MSLNKFPVVGAPVATPAAQTQTSLTAASGTADGTVADVGAAFNQTTLNDNFQEVAAQLALVKTDVAALSTTLVNLITVLKNAN